MLLAADLGPLHARLPAYNAQTVLELARAAGATRLVLTGLSAEAWGNGAWRDLENPLLFAIDAEGFPAEAVGPDWAWAEAERAQFAEFLGQYPQGQARLRGAARLEAPLRALLEKPLDAQAVHSPEVLTAVREYHAALVGLVEEGPGNAHRERRLRLVREALAARPLDGALVLAPLDDLPALLDLPGARPPEQLPAFQPGETSRARALVDRAERLEEGDDLDPLVHGLLDLSGPGGSSLERLAREGRYAAANLYLAVGDLTSARELLDAVVHDQFDKPAYLPGFALARLGQLRDLQGERENAVRAYRAALGLSWLPSEARAVAEAGLRAPFTLG